MPAQAKGTEAHEVAFLEYHYYSGGLRTQHVSLGGERPSWAPAAEWVGFRDEFALKQDDLAVEIVKFSYQEDVVAWIGVYRHSPDQIYGDRQNHAGVGVWLLNQFPSSPALLVESLENLVKLVPPSNREELSAKVNAYLRDYLGGYLSPFRQLPSPLGGLGLASNQIFSTATFQILKGEADWSDSLVGLFYQVFFLATSTNAKNRALILLTKGASGRSDLASPDAKALRGDRFIAEFLTRIPAAFETQKRLINELRSEIAEQAEIVNEHTHRLDGLNTTLEAERSQAQLVEFQYNELKASLTEDDERKRFSILHESLTSINSGVARAIRDLSTLRFDILTEIRKDQRPTIASFNQVEATRRDNNLANQITANSNRIEIDWLKVVFLLIGVGLVIVLIYLLYQIYNSFALEQAYSSRY
jgi:hypothetical protein